MPIEVFKNYDIILGSRSPRRYELLKGLNIPFTVSEEYPVDESYPCSMPPADIPAYLAGNKSEKYPDVLQNQDILITADTLVICDNEVLGKPQDKNDAVRMLKKLSANKHLVITGVCIRSAQKTLLFDESTDVYFSALTNEDINYYIETYKPYDKAGAYGVQEWIGYIGVDRIEGSYYNIMGLPVNQLYNKLLNFIGK